MTKDNFPASIARILEDEGGYVDHPKDPGGATNMGITHQTLASWRGNPVTKADVRALTRAEAIRIYRARYGDVIRFDDLPAGLDHITLDPAINSGPSRGVKWLQAALAVPPAKRDGKMGPQTIAAAVAATDPARVITAAARARMGFLSGLKTWGTFGRGWSRRASSRKEARRGAGVAAGGGGGLSLSDLPDWATWAVAAALLAALIIIIGKRRYHLDRAEAFNKLKGTLR
jgi:lysozyme family protein